MSDAVAAAVVVDDTINDAATALVDARARFTVRFVSDSGGVEFRSADIAYRAVAFYLYLRSGAICIDSVGDLPYGVDWMPDDIRALRRLYSSCMISRDTIEFCLKRITHASAENIDIDDTDDAAGIDCNDTFRYMQQLVSVIDNAYAVNQPITMEILESQWADYYTSEAMREHACTMLKSLVSWFPTPILFPYAVKRFQHMFTLYCGDFGRAAAAYEYGLVKAYKISKAMKCG